MWPVRKCEDVLTKIYTDKHLANCLKLLFAGITILITEWRTKYRRLQNRLDNQRNQTAVDSLLNFETVIHYVDYIMTVILTSLDSFRFLSYCHFTDTLNIDVVF